MPNQPDPKKVLVGVRTPRELVAVLTREAQEHGLKLPGLIVRILQQYVGDPSQRLSRFELEDVEQECRAAQEAQGSRRSARGRSERRGSHYEPELVTGENQGPLSEAVWLSTMNTLASGWEVKPEEDGFYLAHEGVPGHVGVHFQEGAYVVYANYWGCAQAADFSQALKWSYGGKRRRGAWQVPLSEPALGLHLRPIGEGELMAYIRSGKDDALRKLADLLRKLIAGLRAYHRRVHWSSGVQELLHAEGWYAYVEQNRLLRCCRAERDRQVGQVQLVAYEPVENESVRLELQLASGSGGYLRTLLRAMGRRDLASKVYGGRCVLEEIEMPLESSGMVDEALCAERLSQRIAKWMQRVNTALAQGLPLENFAALAVETANHDYASICDLGVVIVRRGKVVRRLRYLVQPRGNAYDALFSEWHGITAESTEQAPSFAEVWAQLAPLIKNMPLVVHSGGVAARLHAAFDQAALARPDFSLLPNLPLARQRFPELSGHNLHDLAAHLGKPITELGALPKAQACAYIARHLYAECGAEASS